jgi:hypothetical protein
MIRCTSRAVALLRTADETARRFNPDARIRLVPDDGGVRFELTDHADPADTILDHDAGFTLVVAPGLAGTVDVVDPHDRLVLIADDEDLVT